jgi:hypothetical protein
MTRKNILRIAAVALVAAAAIAVYQWNKPHRDVASEEATAVFTAEQLKAELAAAAGGAHPLLNQVVRVEGVVASANAAMVLLAGGVSCSPGLPVEVGATIAVKGRVIAYDDLLEEVKLDNCTLAEE